MLHLTGAYTALVTPFTAQGNLNEEGFRQNIAYQIEHGIDGLVVLGTTGESPTLSKEEKTKLITIAKKEIGNQIPLIVGTGSNSTLQTIEDTIAAKELGADLALVVNPYYNKPTQEGLFKHFTAVADASKIPIILYNHPGRCGVQLHIQTMKRLADHPNIIAIKEVTTSLEQINAVMKALAGFSILSGDDPSTFAMMMSGCQGVISVASNLVPAKIKALTDACLQGDLVGSRQQHFELLALFDALSIETNPIPIKCAMDCIGLPAGPCRPPLYELMPENKRHLNELIHALNLQTPELIHG